MNIAYAALPNSFAIGTRAMAGRGGVPVRRNFVSMHSHLAAQISARDHSRLQSTSGTVERLGYSHVLDQAQKAMEAPGATANGNEGALQESGKRST
eukprot:6172952-Pleurochrysis_carterae.AAC.1